MSWSFFATRFRTYLHFHIYGRIRERILNECRRDRERIQIAPLFWFCISRGWVKNFPQLVIYDDRTMAPQEIKFNILYRDTITL